MHRLGRHQYRVAFTCGRGARHDTCKDAAEVRGVIGAPYTTSRHHPQLGHHAKTGMDRVATTKANARLQQIERVYSYAGVYIFTMVYTYFEVYLL